MTGWFEPFLECTAPSIAAADFYCRFIDYLLWFSCDHNFIREEDKFQYKNIQRKIKQYPSELLLFKIELLTMKQQSNIGESQCWYYWSFKCEYQKRKAKRVEGREKALTSVLLACPPTSTVSTSPLWSKHIIGLLGHPESEMNYLLSFQCLFPCVGLLSNMFLSEYVQPITSISNLCSLKLASQWLHFSIHFAYSLLCSPSLYYLLKPINSLIERVFFPSFSFFLSTVCA